MKMSNKTYDILKDVATIWLPALEFFVATVWAIWGIPYSEQIIGTIVAVYSFIGTLLGLNIKSSSKNYWEDVNND